MQTPEEFADHIDQHRIGWDTGGFDHEDVVKDIEARDAEVAAAAKAEALDSAITDVQAIKDDIERGEQP